MRNLSAVACVQPDEDTFALIGSRVRHVKHLETFGRIGTLTSVSFGPLALQLNRAQSKAQIVSALCHSLRPATMRQPSVAVHQPS